jgi:hypothetical protein
MTFVASPSSFRQMFMSCTRRSSTSALGKLDAIRRPQYDGIKSCRYKAASAIESVINLRELGIVNSRDVTAPIYTGRGTVTQCGPGSK